MEQIDYTEIAEIDEMLAECYEEAARLNKIIEVLQTRRISILTGEVEL